MKKKMICILFVLTLALSLSPAALAIGAFADVSDAATAQNVEVLRLMGVLEGNGAGEFHPNDNLTRAEFCKMAVVLTGNRSAVARYASRTMFPDVPAKHWSAGYVNYAAKEAKLIRGLPDGSFAPDRAITYGEAVTILVRLLGYKDSDTSGVWPDGYLAIADAAGMTRGLSAAGSAAITRAQAAKLFVNALTSEDDKGAALYSLLGCSKGKDETVLYSIDLANSKMRTRDGDVKLANPVNSTLLNGLKGYVLIDTASEKAVTFLPSASTKGNAVADAAIIVGANGSTAGFDVLSGGAENYAIYRNGVPSTASALRKNDVVTYSAESNAMLACDTRVTVYYENCTPSPAAPTSITVLGGTELFVLPTAQQSLSKFKPGENMTLLLTSDGRVAGVAESDVRSNAFAYVKSDAEIYLICADNMMKLTLSNQNAKVSAGSTAGEVAYISQSGSNARSTIYLTKLGGPSGDLDPVKKTLGATAVANGALIFDGEKSTSLTALGKTVVPKGRVAYARTNSAGAIDLIVLKDNTDEYYGRVIVKTSDDTQWITVDFGGKTEQKESYFGVRTGDYVSFRYNSDKSNYYNMAPLAKLSSVSASAWIGDSAVNYANETYVVSENVICFNRDSGSWFDSLEAARAYGGVMDLYVKDGVVHIIEVRS